MFCLSVSEEVKFIQFVELNYSSLQFEKMGSVPIVSGRSLVYDASLLQNFLNKGVKLSKLHIIAKNKKSYYGFRFMDYEKYDVH